MSGVTGSRRRGALRVAAAGLSVVLGGCDSGHATLTASVTSADAQELCLAPEDPDEPPDCLKIGSESRVGGHVAPGDCVEVESTTSGVVVAVKRLERSCKTRPTAAG